jgi:hypothetical protein
MNTQNFEQQKIKLLKSFIQKDYSNKLKKNARTQKHMPYLMSLRGDLPEHATISPCKLAVDFDPPFRRRQSVEK